MAPRNDTIFAQGQKVKYTNLTIRASLGPRYDTSFRSKGQIHKLPQNSTKTARARRKRPIEQFSSGIKKPFRVFNLTRQL